MDIFCVDTRVCNIQPVNFEPQSDHQQKKEKTNNCVYLFIFTVAHHNPHLAYWYPVAQVHGVCALGAI